MEEQDGMALILVPAGKLPAGGTVELDYTFEGVPQEPLEMVCALPGHFEAGMHRPITVQQRLEVGSMFLETLCSWPPKLEVDSRRHCEIDAPDPQIECAPLHDWTEMDLFGRRTPCSIPDAIN